MLPTDTLGNYENDEKMQIGFCLCDHMNFKYLLLQNLSKVLR